MATKKRAVTATKKRADDSILTFAVNVVSKTAQAALPDNLPGKIAAVGIRKLEEGISLLTDETDKLAESNEELAEAIAAETELRSYTNKLLRLKSASEAGRHKAAIVNTIASSSYSSISLFDGTPGQLRLKMIAASNASIETHTALLSKKV